MGEEPLLSVLLGTARPVDAAAIGRALAPLSGGLPVDAARAARDGGGIVLDAAPRALAEAAVAALAGIGVAARALPAEAVPPLGRPDEPSSARLAGGVLEVASRALGRRALEWSEARLAIACALDAGEVPPRETDLPSKKRREVETEGPVRPLERDPEVLLAGEDAGLDKEAVRLLGAIARRKRSERRRTSLLVDVVLAGGAVLRLRKETLSEIVLEGPAREHSMARFLSLAREVAAAVAARGAPEAPETEALLWRGLLEPALFRAEDELQRYERWLLAPRG